MRHRPLLTAAAACGLLLAAACGDEPAERGGTEPSAEAVAEAERLYQIVNENRIIDKELEELEQRVVKRCLEDEGLTVHYPAVFPPPSTYLYGASGYLSAAPIGGVPTPEAAEQWGFGLWVDYVYDTDEGDLSGELLTTEARTAFDLPQEETAPADSSEWDAQSDEYRSAWIEAYSGAPAIEGSLKGPQFDSEAPLGGCRLEMIETMYGEPYVEEDEEGTVEYDHEPSPVSSIENSEGSGGLYEQLEDERVEFESCLIDNGYEGWELSDELYPPVWQYFGQMYAPERFEGGTDEGAPVPDLPEEAPSGFRAVMDHEREVASDFAACGVESGLRTAIEEAWAALLVDAYLPIETELVAWQTKMQGHLDDAQDYLQA